MEKRVGLCTHVGSLKKKSFLFLWNIYYLSRRHSKQTHIKQGERGSFFFELLNIEASQPAFNQFGVCYVGMYVMFWLLNWNCIL